MKKGVSLKQHHKVARQESLRELLQNQGHLQYYVDNIMKINDLDENDDNYRKMLDKYKVINEMRLKLINKYLPDLQNVKVEADISNEVTISVVNYSGIDQK